MLIVNACRIHSDQSDPIQMGSGSCCDHISAGITAISTAQQHSRVRNPSVKWRGWLMLKFLTNSNKKNIPFKHHMNISRPASIDLDL